MGGALGSVAGACAGTCLCTALNACLPKTAKASRIGYVVVLFLSVIVALVLRYWGKPLLIHLWITDVELCTSQRCYGYGAVYRISAALFMFYITHAGFSCCKLQSNNWIAKLFFLLITLVVAFVLPEQFYTGYVNVARGASGLFLLAQIVILIDMACTWQESWIEQGRKAAILVISALSYIASGVLLAFLFVWFGAEGCDTQKTIISINLILTLVFSGLSVSPLSRHGIMPAAIVCLYCYWLVFSALTSDPSSCNTLRSQEWWSLVIGLFLAAASISYAAYSVAGTLSSKSDVNTAKESLVKKEENDEEEARVGPAVDEAGVPMADTAVEEVVDPAEEGRVMFKFHGVMALSAMFMAMLLTNWGSLQQAEGREDFSIGKASMWIKVASQWATALLYIWTFIAPKCLPNRNFD